MSRKKKFKLNQISVNQKIKDRNSKTLTIIGVMITSTICYLLIFGKVSIDSATLLSLILAFFSIYLSATFYFKSTEQSNAFYDRSFDHTSNIAGALIEMKASFSKSLDIIEKNNTEIRDKVDNLPEKMNQKEIEKETAEVVFEETKEDFLKKYNIEENEFAGIIEKYNELENTKLELDRLKLASYKSVDYENRDRSVYRKYSLSLLRSLVENNIEDIAECEINEILEVAQENIKNISPGSKRILRNNGFMDVNSKLNKKALDYLARRYKK